MKTYSSYLEELAQFNVNTINLGLGPISALLGRLGNPERRYPTILIGGTNGKGSIAAMTNSVLVQSGYKVGLYTSPHLSDVRERIRVGGEMITPEDMLACIEEVRREVKETLTYFEFLTALAFLYFHHRRVDLAVLEVGMGGRLDATNVVRPMVSIISNIGLDHMEYLGSTVEAIAREKAGIIKEGGICLSGAKQAGVIAVLTEICKERGAKLRLLGRDIKVKRHRDQTFSYIGHNRYNRLKLSLLGRHQVDNGALVVACLEEIARRGFPVTEGDMREGLLKARWAGRLEIVRERPTVLLDGAHNQAGIQSLCRALEDHFPGRRLIVVFGVLNDKKYKQMIKSLAVRADVFINTRPNSSRAVPPADLLPLAALYCQRVIMREEPAAAIEEALRIAAPEDLVLIAGSLYLVGTAREILLTAGS